MADVYVQRKTHSQCTHFHLIRSLVKSKSNKLGGLQGTFFRPDYVSVHEMKGKNKIILQASSLAMCDTYRYLIALSSTTLF